MSVKIDTDAIINNVVFSDQGSNPATPSANKTRVFTKADGLYIINDDGNVIGPFITGTASSSPVGPISDFFAYQTGTATINHNADNKISMLVESRDVNNDYDSVTNYRWTPPSGTVDIYAQIGFSNAVDEDSLVIRIKKNNILVARHGVVAMSSAGQLEAAVALRDIANGSDYYEVFGFVSKAAGSGSLSINGGANTTFWFGSLLKF